MITREMILTDDEWKKLSSNQKLAVNEALKGDYSYLQKERDHVRKAYRIVSSGPITTAKLWRERMKAHYNYITDLIDMAYHKIVKERCKEHATSATSRTRKKKGRGKD